MGFKWRGREWAATRLALRGPLGGVAPLLTLLTRRGRVAVVVERARLPATYTGERFVNTSVSQAEKRNFLSVFPTETI